MPSWRKLGLVIAPHPESSWMATHAMLPVPEARPEGLRLYVTGRDRNGCGQVGHCLVDTTSDPPHVRDVSKEPVIPAGPLGAFDDRGASASALVRTNGRSFLYYTGWTLGVTVPFYVYVGLAISDDNGHTFSKVSRAPILDRSDTDPFLTGHPAVLIENGLWRMWYASGSAWTTVNGAPRHYYHIKYAESTDGISWRRHGVVCVDYASPDEYALGRPWVVKDGSRYRMWFSHRGAAYRIGYAESLDGLTWERLDERAGIDVSSDGWDSEMIEYPCIVDDGPRALMFYNGNGFGRTGIGCAECVSGRPTADTTHRG
jgi:hypothetical protein